ncbi:hypothetical protein QR680_003101 [Steinernema hermaphroditum]|uniref:PDZ domain-containing protein n=1 Tax=Steinernema hermaphroditum TaxID=289476 RepID=A0AA39H801_9BILA|nr:hypothetical protein QR680_003101 [Steinernema hermaphroditum]
MKPGFQLPPDAPAPRSCLIKKQDPNEEYGYNLHAERGKGQFIGAVDDQSPASRAGLRPGDRIFAVNGRSIAGESHRSVVERIKEDPLQCELLVLTEDGANWYQAHGISVSPDLPNIIHLRSELSTLSVEAEELQTKEVYTASTSLIFGGSPAASSPHSECAEVAPKSSSSDSPIGNWYIPKSQAKEDVPPPKFVAPLPPPTEAVPSNGHMNQPRPRLCTLEKRDPTDEFGFNLHAEKGRGHYVGAVDYEGIGCLAGMVLGQRIVGVNGELIYPDTPHKKVVALIKQHPLKTQLLVVSEEVDRWYTENKMPYSFENAIFYRHPSSGPSPADLAPLKRPDMLAEENIPEEPSHSPPPFISESPPVYESPVKEQRPVDDEPVAKTPALSQDDIMDQVFSSVSLAETRVKPHHNDTECVKGVHEIVVGAEADAEPTTAAGVAHNKTSEDSNSATKSVSSRRSEKETVEVADVEDRPKLEPYFSPTPVHTPTMSAGSKVASVTPISRGIANENNNSKFSLESAKSMNDNDSSMDIFKMSASEARARLMNRKKDMRKGSEMSMDEKHRLIANM